MAIRIRKLVQQSRVVFPWGPRRALVNRVWFVFAGVCLGKRADPLYSAKDGTSLGLLMRERPEMFGVLVWPHQVSGWDAVERIDRVVNHCEVIDGLGEAFIFSIEERLVIADLGAEFEGLRVVLDQPTWFMREGQLTMNLFVGDYRAFSVAFSFYRDGEGVLSAVIGGVQGRNGEDSLGLYRDLTKALFGLRPRDLLLEVVRIFSEQAGCTSVLGVSDEHRHHRHRFFGQREFSSSYNDVWSDRGGVRVSDMLFALPAKKVRRDFDTIKPKKRSLYRKRFCFLDELESRMAEGFGAWEPVRFVDL